MLNKDKVREILIDDLHGKGNTNKYFEENINNRFLLNILVELALDDYSSDASMQAAYRISKYPVELLKEIESQLLILQDYELDNIVVHILIALGRIKSEEGLKKLIENRIKPMLFWEAEALKYYFEE